MLGDAEVAVDGEEDADRRAEEFEIASRIAWTESTPPACITCVPSGQSISYRQDHARAPPSGAKIRIGIWISVSPSHNRSNRVAIMDRLWNKSGPQAYPFPITNTRATFSNGRAMKNDRMIACS
jgi:hypothetical protein